LFSRVPVDDVDEDGEVVLMREALDASGELAY